MRTIAAVLPRTGAALEVCDVELEAPHAGEALVRLESSGVCHSDLNAADGTAETPCPAVLGHEGAGVIESVGEGVALQPGTRVALSWMPSCGRCEECVRDLPHLCRTAWLGMGTGGLVDGTSRLSRGGSPLHHYSYLSTFARHAVVPAACCVPIPDDVPAAVAAIVGCAVSTGLGAVWRTARVRPGERVAVIGCGGVGLSAVLGASLAGATPIVAVDVSEAKLELAKQLGATASVVWRAGAEETADAIRDATRGGVDYAIEATGRPEAMQAAFLSTRPRGAAVLIGIPRADAVLTLPALSIPRRELRVMGSAYGSTRPDRDFPATIELYRDGRLPLDRLITHRLPLASAQHALDLVRDGEAVRAVLEMEGELGVTDDPARDVDGRIGEAWSGEAPNGSHINLVVARRGSPTAAAVVGALAAPRPGHVPFLACVEPGVVVRPTTVVVNKSTIDGDALGRMTWGAAQLGIAQGVLDAVADGVLEAAMADEIVLLVAVWVDPAAHDEAAVKEANRTATRAAVADALTAHPSSVVLDVAARREQAHNAFFGEGG